MAYLCVFNDQVLTNTAGAKFRANHSGFRNTKVHFNSELDGAIKS